MKHFALFTLIVFSISVASSIALAGDDSFEIITKRNIFDASRKAEVKVSPQSTPVATPKPVQREYIRLTGTVLTGGQPVAFFSGEVSGRKTVGDAIDEMRIEKVSVNEVFFRGENTSLTLAVGKQIMRENGGAWHVSDVTSMPEKRSEVKADKPAQTNEDEENEIDDEEDVDAEDKKDETKASPNSRSETLKRMMERRQKELN